MKKLSSIAVIALFATGLFLSSCKKDYTCACSISTKIVGSDTFLVTSANTTIKDTKDNASSTCTSANGTTADAFGDTIKTSCVIQ